MLLFTIPKDLIKMASPPPNENMAPPENNKEENGEQEESIDDSKRSAEAVVAAVEENEHPTSSEPASKRLRKEEDDKGNEVLDLAKTLGFKAGYRFEVQWEIHTAEDDDDDNDNHQDTAAAAVAAVNQKSPKTRWWGATLLEHDGRTEDSVAIRTLDYDPYPEGGFPERSQEDVIFLGKDTLVNPVTHDELTYRLEGDDTTETVVSVAGREQIEQVVNETLMKAMTKNAAAWGSMSSAQQALIADRVAAKKEKLVELLLNHDKGVVTSTDMQAILARTMEDSNNKRI